MTPLNQTLRDIPASPGIVIGRVRVVSEFGDLQAPFRLLYTEDERAAELERFKAAVDQAYEDLQHLRKKVAVEFPEHTHLLELHLLILKDQMLYDEPIKFIKEQNLSAEWALSQSFDPLPRGS